MKKMLMTSIMMMVLSVTTLFGMSTSSIRSNARFLSDRMAYELNLSTMQYEDVYEINFDYIYAINRIMDDVVRGYRYAIEEYYDLLDERNDDLRYVLTSRQYREFMECEYFYRPVYRTTKSWAFHIHRVYTNHSHYYFGVPTCYKTYSGAHCRRNYSNYYSNRYTTQSNDRYNKQHSFRENSRRETISKHDFGVNRRDPKPGSNKGNSSTVRPNNQSNNNHGSSNVRPNNGNSSRPNNNSGNVSKPNNQSSNRPSGGRGNGGSSSRSEQKQSSGTVTRGVR